MAIPGFRDDGYLPEGIHAATAAECMARFGVGTRRRRYLSVRLRRWIELANAIGARRLLIDGSFVTAKAEPDDIDAVVLLAEDFHGRLQAGAEGAVELNELLMTKRPEELFAAEDEEDWQRWADFFARTREADARRKGVVEIIL